jgi:hypothetical protein
MKKAASPSRKLAVTAVRPGGLLADVRELIVQAREGVARAVTSGLTLLYWQIGDRIRREVLREKRAEYGKEIVAALGRQLEQEFGRGFGDKNLRRMIPFAEVFPDREIVVSLIRQLTWTHFIALIPLNKPLQRDFYAEIRKCHNSRTLSFSGFRGHGGVVWYEYMNALKETIIEKLDSLPDPTLRQVMDYLTFLTWRGAGEEPSLLSVAGGLSGAPMSGAEIDRELYGQRETR